MKRGGEFLDGILLGLLIAAIVVLLSVVAAIYFGL